MRNGYILSVACDSILRAEDTCAIRPMTPEEGQEFLITGEYPRGRTPEECQEFLMAEGEREIASQYRLQAEANFLEGVLAKTGITRPRQHSLQSWRRQRKLQA